MASLQVCGDKLAVGLNNGKIEVRSLESGEAVRTLEGHTDEIDSLWTLGGKLVSCSCDNTIKVWA